MIGFPTLTESATIFVVSKRKHEMVNKRSCKDDQVQFLPHIPDAAEQNVTACEPPVRSVSIKA